MQPGEGVPGEGVKALSVAWFAQQRRGEALARKLGAEFVKLPCAYRRSPLARMAEYRRLHQVTRCLLWERKPDVVLIQVPPVPALSAISEYARKRGKDFVIDAHSGPFLDQGIAAHVHRRHLAQSGRQALVTLLHNDDLISYAEELGISYLVLEDPVPECPFSGSCPTPTTDVVVVCGYGQDEPVAVTMRAAALMPDVRFFFTGRMPGHYRLPANAVATGFLEERDYWQRLQSSGVVVALTTREATILGGAYDALAVQRPMVLSRTHTLECLFPKGAVLVENQPEAIAEGIRQALSRSEELVRRGEQLRNEKARTWERQFKALSRIITERSQVKE